MKSYRNIYTMILLSFLLASIPGLLLIFTSALPGYASVGSSNNNNSSNPYATLVPTPNMIAAGGPISPNWTMAQEEAGCAAALENPSWYPTLMPAEHHDSERTELFPCAQFPGSFTEPNSVYAYPSYDVYYNPFSMATRGVDEMYIYGGASGDASPPGLQPYVSRVELGTLDEQWRTYLSNVNPIPLEPGEQSTYYAHGAVDPENNRIYAMDAG
ncbi:MAG: hypothetical protein WA941_06950, partial [Nitrososphaeraceae archaeon]